ncbi:hypothetical protein D1B33_14395 [Lysinibacillus yapensis]|uniref:Uncharacterized protein n=1 Tax=Ureibacillus yapensis TaxID=2304605 RepID=A0A396S4V6_9BACL|nr:hypothetical protein [Lysinibacillus yapensis]RHW33991.1 hypothetical protein D1B33_14395 [Lysinibacillus yapensis]
MSEHRNRNDNSNKVWEMDLAKSHIGESGNSDVDVNVNVIVDTTSIAYAYLCSMLATNKMSHEEFRAALKMLKELTSGDKKKDERNEKSRNVQYIENHRERRRRRENR